MSMHLGLFQTARMEQRLVQSPQMIQAMQILQLSSLDLQERIEQELLENPLLKKSEGQHGNGASDGPDPTAEAGRLEALDAVLAMRERDRWDPDLRGRRGSIEESDRKHEAMQNSPVSYHSLGESLLSQLALIELDDRLYELRRPWRDGTRAIAFEPIAFIERLAALVPRPRSHLLTYHGVFAPAAAWRDLIVPSNPEEPSPAPAQDGPDSPDSPRDENVEPAKSGKRGSRQRLSWAELLKRVFSIDVLVCPDCAGPRRVIATITDGPIVRKILEHLGLDADPPTIAPARLPCEPAFDW